MKNSIRIFVGSSLLILVACCGLHSELSRK